MSVALNESTVVAKGSFACTVLCCACGAVSRLWGSRYRVGEPSTEAAIVALSRSLFSDAARPYACSACGAEDGDVIAALACEGDSSGVFFRVKPAAAAPVPAGEG